MENLFQRVERRDEERNPVSAMSSDSVRADSYNHWDYMGDYFFSKIKVLVDDGHINRRFDSHGCSISRKLAKENDIQTSRKLDKIKSAGGKTWLKSSE